MIASVRLFWTFVMAFAVISTLVAANGVRGHVQDKCPTPSEDACICTMEWDPYKCCDGKIYGNRCTATCAGFDLDLHCEQCQNCE
eukprot:CAMPEP_0172443404 /NCGR_PEP_ID=MMETSP1065-20121228/3679_1 /TAXON_ID=265537 /ORGANISM="Amphiprora paludosa, Strain CCMP125" /LENGTH=84 /DNA_ID=CAMNT_0013193623 /DNA_START=67 /DNA_END=321 /DNA_ORIENTATION=+